MRSTSRSAFAVIFVAAACAAPAWAVPITTLYSTGVDENGVPLAGGAVDPHWTLVTSPDPEYPGPQTRVIFSNVPPLDGGYVPNTLTSRWISPRPDSGHNFPRSNCTSGCTDANYYFETSFDLTGLDLESVTVTGQWAMDDAGEMLLNGSGTGVSRPYVQRLNWSTWASFTLTSGFVAGINTLTIVVNNHFFPNSQLRDNPVGLHVQLSGNGTLIPEPGTLMLLLASGVLGLPRRRHRLGR